MEKRFLGNKALSVSEIGLGCMGMSEFYGPGDDPHSIDVIHKALDLGLNFLDTADVYGRGANEELVGKALKGLRQKVVLATKFGIVRTDDPAFRAISGRPEYVKTSCDASLKRLNTDYIDLYYQHRVDTSVPIEETVGAMSELVKAGKVRHLGLSEASAETIAKALTVHPIAALQTEYSLFTRDPETELIAFCKKNHISFVAYSPLGRGFLTGQIKKIEDLGDDDFRRTNPRYQGENFDKNLKLVREVEEIAKEKGCTPSQLALAWVLSQGDHIIPIPGTKKMRYLEENSAAAAVYLTLSEKERLNEILPFGASAGMRYPEAGMKSINS